MPRTMPEPPPAASGNAPERAVESPKDEGRSQAQGARSDDPGDIDCPTCGQGHTGPAAESLRAKLRGSADTEDALTDEQIDEIASEFNVYQGKFDQHSTAVLCDIKDIRAFARALAKKP
jgi:hypothetical protein